MPFSGPAADRQLIRELYDTYSDAVTRADTDAYLGCWTDHGVRSGDGGSCEGRAGLAEHWQGIWRYVERMTFITQIGSIEVRGDGATGRAFCLELLVLRDGTHRRVVGRYDDELRRVDGTWRFAARRYEVVDDPTGPGDGGVA